MIVFERDETAQEEAAREAAEFHLSVKERFPEHADQAHAIIVQYLGRFDRERQKVFLGKMPDPTDDRSGHSHQRRKLKMAQVLICLLLKDRGEVDRPMAEDAMIRKYLDLPYKVIKGGAG